MDETAIRMLQIQSLEPGAHLCFSGFTKKWYVEARIEISDGCTLSGITEHRERPDEAVETFLFALRAVEYPKVLVTNASRHERAHWRWNGAAFASVPLAEMESLVESARAAK